MLPNVDQDTVQQTAATAMEIPEFVIGRYYSRKKEITGRFGGSGRNGIAPSRRSPAIFLFTGTGEQHGYKDRLGFDYLDYVGEGQIDNMQMIKGNLAIASHADNGRALHVFQMTGKGKPCMYLGEFACHSHFSDQGVDRNGKMRSVIVFRLIPVSQTLRCELEDHDSLDGDDSTAQGKPEDLAALREAAVAACRPGGPNSDPKEGVRLAYVRSLRIKRYVRARAHGHCELCDAPAPFNRKSDGTPYLEPHHINRLSDGGLDHPKYVGAICPTCHRLIHFGENGQHRNDELRARIAAKEAPFAGGNGE
ncbi:HNH endonuclease [Ralstonia chuxiongensis]|uniref:HNH endonuclease n=1 Tax=Ralstonia chuxiongensis TaxID=2957504 RepID=UPI0028F599C0|nr:HNH endonuclease signature motif containing protein [Ralstonia chuxiongensis]CAJ0778022.1 hypothetical protein R8510_04439 [Ralstonia chuxiongensis]